MYAVVRLSVSQVLMEMDRVNLCRGLQGLRKSQVVRFYSKDRILPRHLSVNVLKWA